jgi:hypothetical protein
MELRCLRGHQANCPTSAAHGTVWRIRPTGRMFQRDGKSASVRPLETGPAASFLYGGTPVKGFSKLLIWPAERVAVCLRAAGIGCYFLSASPRLWSSRLRASVDAVMREEKPWHSRRSTP